MWNEKWKIIDLSGGFFVCKKKEEKKENSLCLWARVHVICIFYKQQTHRHDYNNGILNWE